jgi:hypothetical protein
LSGLAYVIWTQKGNGFLLLAMFVGLLIFIASVFRCTRSYLRWTKLSSGQ